MIVNWREHAHHDFEFKLEDLGVVAKADQLIEVWDLWTHEMLGEYTKQEVESFGVSKIPGHGNFVFKFVVKDRPSETEFNPVFDPIVEPVPVEEPRVIDEVISEPQPEEEIDEVIPEP